MTFFRKKHKSLPEQEHPAYKAGVRFGYWLIRQEHRAADWLNNAQFELGVGWRNAILLSLFIAFAIYFIRVFIQPN